FARQSRNAHSGRSRNSRSARHREINRAARCPEFRRPNRFAWVLVLQFSTCFTPRTSRKYTHHPRTEQPHKIVRGKPCQSQRRAKLSENSRLRADLWWDLREPRFRAKHANC